MHTNLNADLPCLYYYIAVQHINVYIIAAKMIADKVVCMTNWVYLVAVDNVHGTCVFITGQIVSV